jgi:hypothetical protein
MGERRSTGGTGPGAGGGAGSTGRADSWRAIGRRAVRLARQRELGGKALLLGAGALGGALAGAFLTARGATPSPVIPAPGPRRPEPIGPPALRGPATGTALVWVVVRIASR